MSIKKVDHIAIAVTNLEESAALYGKLLGKNADHREEIAEQKVRTAFFSVGDTNLELVFPISPDSPVSKFLEKNPKGGLHHICFQVKNIEAHLKKLKSSGVELIDEKPRMGAKGKRIAFIHPWSTGGVLIELSE